MIGPSGKRKGSSHSLKSGSSSTNLVSRVLDVSPKTSICLVSKWIRSHRRRCGLERTQPGKELDGQVRDDAGRTLTGLGRAQELPDLRHGQDFNVAVLDPDLDVLGRVSRDPFAFAAAIVEELAELGPDIGFAPCGVRELADKGCTAASSISVTLSSPNASRTIRILAFDLVKGKAADLALLFLGPLGVEVGVDRLIDGGNMRHPLPALPLTHEEDRGVQKRPGAVQMREGLGGVPALGNGKLGKPGSPLIVLGAGDLLGIGQGLGFRVPEPATTGREAGLAAVHAEHQLPVFRRPINSGPLGPDDFFLSCPSPLPRAKEFGTPCQKSLAKSQK